MEHITKKLDQLNLENEKEISQKLDQDEELLLSCKLFKFNDYGKKQERFLMITNKGVYNLKNRKTIQRKIEFSQIEAITVSSLGTEFILHVKNANDYRWASYDMRTKILLHIIEQYTKNVQTKLSFFFKEDQSLEIFQTTKLDVKKGFNRKPTEQEKQLDVEEFKEAVGINKNKNQTPQQSVNSHPVLFSRSLDAFKLIKVLGRGAFGKVVLVQEKETGELMAMKQIKKEEIIQKDQLNNTKMEKMILKHLNHPYLVQLYYAFQDSQSIYFVMQFMKGGELYQHLLKERKFEESRVKFYVAQLVLALGYLHSKDIIYRDLKLENILMDGEGNICLSDFGLAKMIKSNEKAMTFCGTSCYLAPEVVRGKGADKMSDWWSLGSVTYEMLYTVPPFYNKNEHTMYQNILGNDVAFSEKVQISEQAKDFIKQILEKDSSKRLGFQNDYESLMAHSWFEGMDWQSLKEKKITPPFKPNVDGDNFLQNFDQDYVNDNPNPTKYNRSYIDDKHSLFKYFNENSLAISKGLF